MSCNEVPSKKQWERSPSYLSPSNLEIADMDSEEEGERGPVPTAATLSAGVPGTVLQGLPVPTSAFGFCTTFGRTNAAHLTAPLIHELTLDD